MTTPSPLAKAYEYLSTSYRDVNGPPSLDAQGCHLSDKVVRLLEKIENS
jgi:hypothetical protein